MKSGKRPSWFLRFAMGVSDRLESLWTTISTLKIFDGARSQAPDKIVFDAGGL